MKQEFYVPSKDGETQIHVVEWIPEGERKAILQICHGMVEHIGRYNEFASFLAENGIYVVGHDHLGHGKSVTEKDKLGFFHDKDGNACVIGDIHKIREITQEKYPDIPYFMLGHSMGSFLLRQYLGLYSRGLAGAVVMGTGEQPGIVLGAGKLVCKTIALFKGWKHRSNFVNSLAAGGYEKKMGRAWLSKNVANVEKYKEDPLSGFVFTLNAYYHMFDGMSKMNKSEKQGKTEKDLPIFFVAGDEDLVGNCGKGVKTVFHRYQKKGYQDVEMKLYAGDRHEILNEDDKDVVYQDILNWIERKK